MLSMAASLPFTSQAGIFLLAAPLPLVPVLVLLRPVLWPVVDLTLVLSLRAVVVCLLEAGSVLAGAAAVFLGARLGRPVTGTALPAAVRPSDEE